MSSQDKLDRSKKQNPIAAVITQTMLEPADKRKTNVIQKKNKVFSQLTSPSDNSMNSVGSLDNNRKNGSSIYGQGDY